MQIRRIFQIRGLAADLLLAKTRGYGLMRIPFLWFSGREFLLFDKCWIRKKAMINLDVLTARYYQAITCRYDETHILLVPRKAWHFAIQIGSVNIGAVASRTPTDCGPRIAYCWICRCGRGSLVKICVRDSKFHDPHISGMDLV